MIVDVNWLDCWCLVLVVVVFVVLMGFECIGIKFECSSVGWRWIDGLWYGYGGIFISGLLIIRVLEIIIVILVNCGC